MLLSGTRFNQQYTDRLIKLTNQLETHNGYQFHTGLNIDHVAFNPQGNCAPGGIYFCSIEHLSLWLEYSSDQMIYARPVTIPNDAQVWVEKNKFKADRLLLGDRVKIHELDVWLDPQYNLRACKLNGFALQYVKEQTSEINLQAVQNNGYALQYVKDQTPAVCLASVKQYGFAIKYVKDQTTEICLQAVRNNRAAAKYIRDPETIHHLHQLKDS